jgi:hypothetical protein
MGRVEKANRPHEVGVEHHHAVTFAAGEAGDPEVHLPEVAQAAVDQLG